MRPVARPTEFTNGRAHFYSKKKMDNESVRLESPNHCSLGIGSFIKYNAFQWIHIDGVRFILLNRFVWKVRCILVI